MKPLHPLTQQIVAFNAARPVDLAKARRAATTLMNRSTRTEQALIMAFVTGRRKNLAVFAPRWAVEAVGAILHEYAGHTFDSPTARAQHALSILRSRLIIALGLVKPGMRL